MNGPTHRWAAAGVVGCYLAHSEAQAGVATLKPIAGAGIAAAFTNLPDVLEPAVHPHHRQSCHSVAAAVLVGYGLYRVVQWQPDDSTHRAIRFFLLVSGSAYLIHLALDALTTRSIPLFGKGFSG